jgi:metal-sulfur cluster biosynthetic enzyme
MVKEVNVLQPLKARFPIDITEFGMVTEVNPLQSANVKCPIDVTEFGIL